MKLETSKPGNDPEKKRNVSMKTHARRKPLGHGGSAKATAETRTSSHLKKNIHEVHAGAPNDPRSTNLTLNRRGKNKAMRYKPGKAANR